MTAAVRMTLLLTIYASLAGSPATSAGQDSWPLFRGDPASRGVAATALADNLVLHWKFEVEGGAFASAATIVDGRVYVADLDGTLYALNGDNGAKIWEYQTEIGFTTTPAFRHGRLYLGDLDGVFYCVAANDGKLLWKFTTNGEIDSSANFFGDNVLFGSQDAALYCLDSQTGKQVWKFEIDDQIRCSPSILDGHAFVAGCDGRLHIVDLAKGTSVGNVVIDGPTGVTPAVEGTQVYFGTEGGTLYSINWRQQEITWEFRDEENARSFRSSPAIGAQHLVVASKMLYAIDKARGTKIWTFAARRRIESSPVIAGNRVYFGTPSGRVHALDLTTGRQLWQYETGGSLAASPAIAEGKLVISSDDGVVYCFQAAAAKSNESR